MLLISQNMTIQVYGARISTYYILFSKTYHTFRGLFWSPAGSWQAARSTRIWEACLFNRVITIIIVIIIIIIIMVVVMIIIAL